MTARASQITPPGDWRSWLILAGRGWGKTRTGAEDVAYHALWERDARDTCMEGASGLLKIVPRACIAAWNRSMGELILVNGSRFKLFSADEPERLRGPQFTRAWADELAAWKSPAALDQLMMGLRLGNAPRLVATTTPKPVAWIKDMVARQISDVHVTRGRSEENATHLAPGVLEGLRARYGATRFARQELDAEIIEEVTGALWSIDRLAALRVMRMDCAKLRCVVALDPAVTSHARSDETGIVAAALGEDGIFYVLADASARYTPDQWAQRALQLKTETDADLIIGEVNEGGDLIERMLRMHDAYVPYRAVRAAKAKAARAWPVALLYERGLVRHVGAHPKLEDQMCRFTSEGLAQGSPDRVDALVWALNELQQGAGRDPRVRS